MPKDIKTKKTGDNSSLTPASGKLNVSLLNKIIIVFGGCLFMALVAAINDISVKGIVMQELRKEYTTLQKENDQVEIKVMTLESYENIDKRARELKMVKVDKVNYINIDQAMAKK